MTITFFVLASAGQTGPEIRSTGQNNAAITAIVVITALIVIAALDILRFILYLFSIFLCRFLPDTKEAINIG
jgi:hypothetical protein